MTWEAIEQRLFNHAGRDHGSAEMVEGREPDRGEPAKDRQGLYTEAEVEAENPQESPGVGAENLLSGLERVREAARRNSPEKFTALLHHVTVDLLRAAYHKLNPRAASGVDGVTWKEYGQGLEERLADLHGRVHSGHYHVKPSKRIYLPKSDGKRRPIGIAAMEDKIVQQAVGWVLEQIYEEEFLGFSYGFRPGRSTHQALDAIWVAIMQRKVNWVVDADVRSFFDNLDHGWMERFLGHRIGDRRVLRLIHKWLRAGVSEEGEWSETAVGTPQGAVISPLLANIYLHYVLDLWVQRWRKKEAKGEVVIVRYGDDSILGFQYREDAERFLRDLEVRMQQFGLEVHAEKTRLIEFGRFAKANRERRGEAKPETFDFLGFTHICGLTRNGRFTLKRRSISKRLRRKVREVSEELRAMRHAPVPEQGNWLRHVIQGYFNYHAVPGNRKALDALRTLLARAWFRSLRTRSQKARHLTWDRMQVLISRWFPKSRTLHPYPSQRLCVNYPR